jgi:hypothetical protein
MNNFAKQRKRRQPVVQQKQPAKPRKKLVVRPRKTPGALLKRKLVVWLKRRLVGRLKKRLVVVRSRICNLLERLRKPVA